MPFFDLRIRWVESSDFGPKSDDLGHRILIFFYPVEFGKIGLHKQAQLFLRSKIIIRSSESDRVIISLTVAVLFRNRNQENQDPPPQENQETYVKIPFDAT